MAIVALDKVTLYGTVEQKDMVLDGLQRLGCLHMVELREPGESGPAAESIAGDAREALRYLRGCPVQRRQTKSREDYDLAKVDAEILAVKRKAQALQDERDELHRTIGELKPWGKRLNPPRGQR